MLADLMCLFPSTVFETIGHVEVYASASQKLAVVICHDSYSGCPAKAHENRPTTTVWPREENGLCRCDQLLP